MQRRAVAKRFDDPCRVLTQREAGAKLNLSADAQRKREARFLATLTPEQRANFKRATSRKKRRVRATSYTESPPDPS
jgi:hypothetical protein